MKKFVVWLLVLIMAFAINVVPALAATDATSSNVSAQTEINPRAEETVWVVRVVDGKRQRRLWSITYGEWLTDWMDWPEN